MTMMDTLSSYAATNVSQWNMQRKKTMTKYEEVFSTLYGHFLTQALPNNWQDFDDEYLEEWFTECDLDTYEYWDWEQVYKMISDLTDTVMELYNASWSLL